MIQSVTVTNLAGESITLELRNPESSGFFIQDIDGLGPCKATINNTEMASNDGAIFNSARLTSRNITLLLGFTDSPSVEENRLKSYRYFPIKRPVTLRVKTDQRDCQTIGYVESNEIDIFSKAENGSISIICPDPYFYSLLREVTVFGTDEAAFQFPFSNESLTQKVVIFSIMHSDTTKTVFYQGDASVGIVMYVHAIGPANNLKIFDLSTYETLSIDSAKLAALTGSDIIEGDDIVISTVRGNKSILLYRGGNEINILNCINRDASWFQLNTGDNILAYTADNGLQNLQFRVENQIVYEGV